MFERFVKKVKDFFTVKDNTKTVIIATLSGAAIYELITAINPAYASYGEAFIGLAVFLFALKLIDDFWLKNIDIVNEIKDKNIALSIFIGSLFVGFMHFAASVVAGYKPN